MRVFHSPGSRSTRVVWTLEEIGAPYDVTVLTLDERRGDEHRKRHPLGRVPALELDDGRVMFESAAICLYLADRFPEAGLAPTPDSADRAFLYQWTVFSMTEFENGVMSLYRARQAEQGDEAETERLAEVARTLEQALDGKQWLLGDTFTVADILNATIASLALKNDFLPSEPYPALADYVERVHARPARERADAVGRE
jgi:glutathione S-transferase